MEFTDFNRGTRRIAAIDLRLAIATPSIHITLSRLKSIPNVSDL